ncbi:MAG TPA: TonB C-terminal domain-containing protein [Stellaceae bacterium]|nr:TonB C-terminal domain-containing protein [Stellaceae bacterium]
MTILLESAGSRLPLPLLGKRERIAYWAIAAALLLHVVIAIVCLVDWAALLDLALARANVADAIPVTLVYAPPPPPAPPPQPVVQPQPQLQPQPSITPRMSGEGEKTEAKQEDTPQPALPQPKSPPPQSAQQQKRPVPARPGSREPATVTAQSPTEREAALEPETRKEAQPAPLFHSIRLPSQHGGTGERDTSGDAYLNKMKDVVERHRIYPPASAFLGGEERLVILSILIEPSGELVQVRLQATSGLSLADEAAANMIRNSAPFGPIPASYPHIRTSITVEMPIYPNPR